MKLGFSLSPYLRPYRDSGALVLDDAMVGRHLRLEPLEADLVTALWQTPSAEIDIEVALERLAEEHGLDKIARVIVALEAAGVLVRDRDAAEQAWQARLDSVRPDVPFVDQVELTNHCPMRCGFCPRGVPGAMSRSKGFMDLSLFRALLTQLHPRQSAHRPLELHHLGESLLHPELPRFVQLATAAGLPSELSVNPSHLEGATCDELLTAGLSRLVISLDATDPQTLVHIRGPAARYDKAERHLTHLLQRVGGMSNPPTIIIQMIALHANRHLRDDFLERWGQSGLPTVSAVIKTLDGPDPDLGAPNEASLSYLCTYPWRSVVVLWDGRVVPCCRDADADVVLGDLRESSLEAIWNGPEATRLRELHRAQAFPEGHLCHGCEWSRERFAARMPERHPDRARQDPYRW